MNIVCFKGNDFLEKIRHPYRRLSVAMSHTKRLKSLVQNPNKILYLQSRCRVMPYIRIFSSLMPLKTRQ